MTVRESPDRPTLGRITEIDPGTDFPAESFFDVFFEVDLNFLGLRRTLVNPVPVPMRRIIDEIPPLLIDYLPPPDLLVHLYDKASGAYWGCMRHPSHFTLPPVIKTVSVPDPTSSDIVEFEITVRNPHGQRAIEIDLLDYLIPSADGWFWLVSGPELVEGPGCAYVDNPENPQHIIWEANCDLSDNLQPVQLGPLQQAVIRFSAQV